VQLYTNFTNKLSRRGKIDFSFFKGIRLFSSWIACNIRKDIFFKKKLSIGEAIVSCVRKKSFNFLLFVFKEVKGFFCKFRKMVSVPGISRSNFIGDRDRKKKLADLSEGKASIWELSMMRLRFLAFIRMIA
jgi:hypothetical protein